MKPGTEPGVQVSENHNPAQLQVKCFPKCKTGCKCAIFEHLKAVELVEVLPAGLAVHVRVISHIYLAPPARWGPQYGGPP